MLCWGSQRRNLMWAIHYNVTVFITFKASDVGAVPCYVIMFLALETSIFIICHHVDCRWWSDGGSQLLYSIKLFNFRYCIAEHLWSLLIYVAGQTMGLLQTLNEYPEGGCIICEIAPLSFCPESVDACCEGLLFMLLDLHEA